MKKMYISAPMTGKKDFNRETFNQGCLMATELGFVPICPLSMDAFNSENVMRAMAKMLNRSLEESVWIFCICRDIVEIAKCQAILFMKGWEKSYGCGVEYLVARRLGIDLYFETEDDDEDGKWFDEQIGGVI